MDRFLNEIRKFHAIRRGLAGLSDQLQVEFAASFDASIARQWHLKARDAQLPPTDLANFWLFMAVRGSGKSEAMPQAAHLAVKAGIRRMHIVARTAADVRDVIVQGHPACWRRR